MRTLRATRARLIWSGAPNAVKRTTRQLCRQGYAHGVDMTLMRRMNMSRQADELAEEESREYWWSMGEAVMREMCEEDE